MESNLNKVQSRREFLGKSVTVLTAASFIPSLFSCASKSEPVSVESVSGIGQVNSNFGGVQIGAITYSWRSMPGGLENVIDYCREANISSIELMSGDLETYLGAPQFNPGQETKKDQYKKDIKEWRLALDMAKVEAARKCLDEAGIKVHIVKFSPSRLSDEEIDYAFKTAKVMGAKAITDEINMESAKRLAPFAEKHGMYIAFHNHMQYAEEGFSCDPILAVSPAVMLNFDAGHFYGSTGIHPNEMIKKYHDRIYSIHLKDKTGPTVEDQPNANQVWGQGEMPIADVLLLIKQEKWPIYCDIELEYDIKPWSNSVKEVATCVKYAKEILM